MNINITSFMSPEEILNAAHSATAIPAIWILYIFYSLIFLLVGLIFIYVLKIKKFWLIWIVTILLGIIIAIFLTLSPNTIQLLINFWIQIK